MNIKIEMLVHGIAGKKKLGQTLYGTKSYPIAKKGEIITREIIEEANRQNCLENMIYNMQ